MTQKGFAPIIILVGLVIAVVAAGAFYLGRQSILHPGATATPSVLPSPSASLLPDSLILYSHLNKNIPNQEMEKFLDDVLKVSFLYPKKYFSKIFKADERNLYAGIFFLKERNEEKEKYIRYVIDCTLDNRRDPAGVCRESTAGDLEVSINKADKIPDYDEDKSSEYNEFQCEKETIGDNKIVYSCLTPLSVDLKDKGMRYSLYLTEDTPKVIRISTRKPVEFSDLITGIVNSAKVLP